MPVPVSSGLLRQWVSLVFVFTNLRDETCYIALTHVSFITSVIVILFTYLLAIVFSFVNCLCPLPRFSLWLSFFFLTDLHELIVYEIFQPFVMWSLVRKKMFYSDFM